MGYRPEELGTEEEAAVLRGIELAMELAMELATDDTPVLRITDETGAELATVELGYRPEELATEEEAAVLRGTELATDDTPVLRITEELGTAEDTPVLRITEETGAELTTVELG